MLGVEREEDATALFSSVLGNLDGEGRQIDDYERTLTGINDIEVATFPWLTPIRTRKPDAESVAE